jgi:hypothetical protein
VGLCRAASKRRSCATIPREPRHGQVTHVEQQAPRFPHEQRARDRLVRCGGDREGRTEGPSPSGAPPEAARTPTRTTPRSTRWPIVSSPSARGASRKISGAARARRASRSPSTAATRTTGTFEAGARALAPVPRPAEQVLREHDEVVVQLALHSRLYRGGGF